MKIEEIIKNISDADHYLLKSKNAQLAYYNDFSKAILYVKEKLTEKQYSVVCK